MGFSINPLDIAAQGPPLPGHIVEAGGRQTQKSGSSNAVRA
jgi:hypothetical protein